MLILRWIGRGLLAILALGALALGIVYAFTEYQMRRRVASPATVALAIPGDSAAVARGRHLADAVLGCSHCHGPDLGGHVLVDEPLVLRLAAPNLTSGAGGRLQGYTDAALDVAVRHGVAPDGRLLRFMPSHEYAGVADDQMAAVIAYLRSVPAIDRDVGPLRVGPVARLLVATKALDLLPYHRIDHRRRPPAVAPVGATSEHGRYLAAGCVGCHGEGLSGGKIPGAPPDWPAAANLTPIGIGAWTDTDFLRAMREGVRPDGSPIDSVMPWKQLGGMTDEELLALRRYLATVAPRASGTR